MLSACTITAADCLHMIPPCLSRPLTPEHRRQVRSHIFQGGQLSLLPLKQQNQANIVSRAKEGFLLRWLIGENQFMEQEYIFVVSLTQGTGFGAAVEQCLGRVNSIAASHRNE